MPGLTDHIATALSGLPMPKAGPKPTLLRRALSRDDFEVCWEWPGRLGQNGYGLATQLGSRTQGTSAHRVVWELLFGPLEPGQQLDHLCHDPKVCKAGIRCPHRRCVNPTHLAVVTPRQNTMRSNAFTAANARKTACHVGHDFTPENTYVDPRGRRACRTCQRAHWRRYYAERKAS